MPSCAVPGCNHGIKAKRPKGVKLHSFPRDESLHNLWLSVCGRAEDVSDSSKHDLRVCSAHFVPSDYERDLRWELMHSGKEDIAPNPQRKLKPKSVPSKGVPYPTMTIVA